MVVLPASHLSIWHCSPLQVVTVDCQMWFAWQLPVGHAVGHSTVPPQPLPIVPQYWPPPAGLQLMGVQALAGAPHTPAMPPPPQVWGAPQPPQSTVPPQPSPIMPQYLPPPVMLHVSGTQPDAGTQMPPLQARPAGQVLQS